MVQEMKRNFVLLSCAIFIFVTIGCYKWLDNDRKQNYEIDFDANIQRKTRINFYKNHRIIRNQIIKKGLIENIIVQK